MLSHLIACHQATWLQGVRIDAYRAVNLWNALSDDTVNVPNFDSFNYYINNIN